MDFAFVVTPGLEVFLGAENLAFVISQAELSLFYSITVLALFGHMPVAVFVGLVMYWRRVSVENAVSLASILWFVLAVLSVTLLILGDYSLSVLRS